MAADVAPAWGATGSGSSAGAASSARCGRSCSPRASERANAGLNALRPVFFGSDPNAALLGAAKQNAQAAGVCRASSGSRITAVAQARAPAERERGPGDRESALRRAHRRARGAEGDVRGDRRIAQARVRRLARRDHHERGGARPRDRPARRAVATSSSTARSSACCSCFDTIRTGELVRATSARCRPARRGRATGCARTSSTSSRALKREGDHLLSASTTPTCPNTPRRSTSTRLRAARRTCLHVQEYAPPSGDPRGQGAPASRRTWCASRARCSRYRASASR